MKLSSALSGVVSSLAARCLACFLVYAGLMIALFLGASALADQQLSRAFPTMETVLQEEDALARDQFEALSSFSLARCDVLVFDGDGRRLYASSPEAADRVSARDLAIINDYSDLASFYDVMEFPEGDGVVYVVARYWWDDDEVKEILDYCVLDEDLTIREGTLFPDRSALSQREFDLLRGVYENRTLIEKHGYLTAAGEPRTLVLLSPVVTEAAYDQAVDESGRIWAVAIPLAVILTVAAAVIAVRVVRRGLRPLDQAIAARAGRTAAPPDPSTLALELRPTYRVLSETMDELDAAHDENRRIVADISHDLKTPLTVVSGYAKALEEGLVPKEKRAAYLRALSDRSLEASRLIDELFEYAKMEHPEYVPECRVVDVAQLVSQAAADREPVAEQAGCSLEVDAGADPLPAAVDPMLFGRMVANLVDNACKHNPAGTRVRLACERRGALARVIVADTGRGLPENLSADVFEPFVTNDESRTPGAHGGTGLGLSIVRRCAQLCGATVRFSPTPPAPFVTEAVIEVPLAPSARSEE